MLEIGIEEDLKLPISLSYMKIKYNFTPGSEDSICFHQAMGQSEQMGIFSTEAIDSLIKYKWSILRIVGLVQAIGYVAMMLLMFIGHSRHTDSFVYLILLWVC